MGCNLTGPALCAQEDTRSAHGSLSDLLKKLSTLHRDSEVKDRARAVLVRAQCQASAPTASRLHWRRRHFEITACAPRQAKTAAATLGSPLFSSKPPLVSPPSGVPRPPSSALGGSLASLPPGAAGSLGSSRGSGLFAPSGSVPSELNGVRSGSQPDLASPPASSSAVNLLGGLSDSSAKRQRLADSVSERQHPLPAAHAGMGFWAGSSGGPGLPIPGGTLWQQPPPPPFPPPLVPPPPPPPPGVSVPFNNGQYMPPPRQPYAPLQGLPPPPPLVGAPSAGAGKFSSAAAAAELASSDLAAEARNIRAAIDQLPSKWDSPNDPNFASAVELMVRPASCPALALRGPPVSDICAHIPMSFSSQIKYRVGKYRQADHPQRIEAAQAVQLVDKLVRKVRDRLTALSAQQRQGRWPLRHMRSGHAI